MSTKPHPLEAQELIHLAVNGLPIPIERALATYANPQNWKQLYGGQFSDGNMAKPCEWAFVGPVRPGYELAEHALEQADKPDPITSAIERMQAVTVEELVKVSMEPTSPYGLQGKVEAIRARLIQAAQSEST